MILESIDSGIRNQYKMCIRDSLHPISSEAERSWTPGKDIIVARRLRAMGYDPTFALSLDERAQWQPLLAQACLLYTSRCV